MGVTVFFVISGFLLYRPFVAGDMAGRGTPRTLTFYRRRVLRIFPAYWFALAVFALLPGVISIFDFGWWWRYVFLIQNYSSPHIVFQPGIGPAWSLSVELAFYFVLPFFAWAMRNAVGRDPNRRLVADLCVLATIAVASYAIRSVLVSDIQDAGGLASSLTWTATLTLPLYLGWFAIGMGFASLSAWTWRTGKTPEFLRKLTARPGLVWLCALAVYAFLVLGFRSLPSGEFPADHLLTALIAGALVFPAAFPHPDGGAGVPARVLSARYVAWIGLISYGIYLWAGPITVMLRNFRFDETPVPFLTLTLAVLPLALAAGAFSFYVVERPFLRLKNRRPGTSASTVSEPAPQHGG